MKNRDGHILHLCLAVSMVEAHQPIMVSMTDAPQTIMVWCVLDGGRSYFPTVTSGGLQYNVL